MCVGNDKDKWRDFMYRYVGPGSMPKSYFGTMLATVHSWSCGIEGAGASRAYARMMDVSFTDQKVEGKVLLPTCEVIVDNSVRVNVHIRP